MHTIKWLVKFSLIAIICSGCSPENQAPSPATTFAEYQAELITDDQRHTTVQLLDDSGALVASIDLPGGEQIADTQDELQLCTEMKASNCKQLQDRLDRLVSWSPNRQYLAITAGHLEGIWFVPMQHLASPQTITSNIIKVAIEIQRDDPEWGITKTGLFHFPVGWQAEDQFFFSAGLSGLRGLYRIDLSERELRGKKYSLSDQSSDIGFINMPVDDYESQSGYVTFDDVTKQVSVLNATISQ